MATTLTGPASPRDQRFFGTGFLRSFVSITLGGAVIATVGAVLGAVS